MRYSVFDGNGIWQGSYSHNIPNVPINVVKDWAVQNAKLCAGKVYETIVPKDKRYDTREHLLYDFTHHKSKLEETSKYKKKQFKKKESKS